MSGNRRSNNENILDPISLDKAIENLPNDVRDRLKTLNRRRSPIDPTPITEGTRVLLSPLSNEEDRSIRVSYDDRESSRQRSYRDESVIGPAISLRAEETDFERSKARFGGISETVDNIRRYSERKSAGKQSKVDRQDDHRDERREERRNNRHDRSERYRRSDDQRSMNRSIDHRSDQRSDQRSIDRHSYKPVETSDKKRSFRPESSYKPEEDTVQKYRQTQEETQKRSYRPVEEDTTQKRSYRPVEEETQKRSYKPDPTDDESEKPEIPETSEYFPREEPQQESPSFKPRHESPVQQTSFKPRHESPVQQTSFRPRHESPVQQTSFRNQEPPLRQNQESPIQTSYKTSFRQHPMTPLDDSTESDYTESESEESEQFFDPRSRDHAPKRFKRQRQRNPIDEAREVEDMMDPRERDNQHRILDVWHTQIKIRYPQFKADIERHYDPDMLLAEKLLSKQVFNRMIVIDRKAITYRRYLLIIVQILQIIVTANSPVDLYGLTQEIFGHEGRDLYEILKEIAEDNTPKVLERTSPYWQLGTTLSISIIMILVMNIAMHYIPNASKEDVRELMKIIQEITSDREEHIGGEEHFDNVYKRISVLVTKFIHNPMVETKNAPQPQQQSKFGRSNGPDPVKALFS